MDSVTLPALYSVSKRSLKNSKLFCVPRSDLSGRGTYILKLDAAPGYSGGPTVTTKWDAGSVLLALVM